MAALTADRLTRTRGNVRGTFSVKVAANAVGYQGGLVAVDANGLAHAAVTTVGYRVVGVALRAFDNTGGADGDIKVVVESCVAKFDNDGAQPVVQADVGRLCFVKDDHTVQIGNGGSAVIAGRIEEIDADGGVWVKIDSAIGGVSGSAVDIIGDNNTTGGIALVHVFQIADAADADYDLVLKEKFQVLDVIVRKTGAGAANTATVKNAGNAISDAIAAGVDKAVTRAGTLDPAFDTIAANGTLRVSVHRAAGSGAMQVTVVGRKVA